jgi:ectoine hydroxylase-related dioxygenase (phytanoyl-CoA dioxygenase family)
VLRARSAVVTSLQDDFACVTTSADNLWPAASARAVTGATTKLLTGFEPLTHHPTVLPVVQHPHVAKLVQRLLASRDTPHQQPSIATFNTKWLRCIAPGDATDLHCDYYRFHGDDAHAEQMVTVWQPLGDYNHTDQGTLIVCAGSHQLLSHAGAKHQSRITYDDEKCAEYESKEIDVELPVSWDSYCASANQRHLWHTADFEAGDLVIFDIRLVHGSTRNNSHDYRISIDTRWQSVHCIPEHAVQGFQRMS